MGWATEYIRQLADGKTVKFRPRGNSMTGRVNSGQLCTVVPYNGQLICKGDVVLCKVKGSQFLHLVSACRPNQVQISNNHGHVNGWINLANIFGVLTDVES